MSGGRNHWCCHLVAAFHTKLLERLTPNSTGSRQPVPDKSFVNRKKSTGAQSGQINNKSVQKMHMLKKILTP